MSKLPPGWEWTTLGEVAESVKNGIYVSRPGATPDGVPILRINAVRPSELRLDEIRYSGKSIEELQSEGALLEPDDLLFTRYSGSRDYVGVCTIIPDKVGPLTYPDKIIRVRTRQVEPKYVMFAFSSPSIRSAVESSLRTTAGQVGISGTNLKAVRIPLAPFAEQRRIVAALEEQFPHLDACGEILRSIRSNLSGLKKSLLSRTFDLDEAQSRGWLVRRLGEVVLVASGNTPRGIGELLGVECDSSIPFYKVGDMNLSDGRILLRSRTYLASDSASRLGVRVRPAGTVLIPKRGGAIATNKKRIMGRDGAYDLNTVGLLPTGELNPTYLWWWLQRLDLTSIADGSNIPQINHPDLNELLIPVPTKAAQEEISAELDDQLDGALDDSLVWVDRRIPALRRSILGDAFSGRLVPQDPNDEPASVLLERIKAERAAEPKRKRGRRVTKDLNQGSLL